MQNVIRFAAITCLLATGVSLSTEARAACATAGLKPYKVLIDWTNEPTYLGVYRAKFGCLFQKLGLDVTIDQSQGANQAVAAVAAGRYPVATASGGATVLARNNKAEIVSLGVLYPRISTVVYGLATTGVKAPADLVGKRIGIYPESINRNEFDAFVRVNRLNPQGFQIVSLSGSDVSALLSRSVDAALNYGEMSPMILATNPEAKEVDGKRIFQLPLADFGVSGYGLNVVTSRATLAANDTQVRAVANAIFEGYKEGCANQSAAVAEFAKEFPNKNATYVRDSWARACAIVGPAPGKQDAAGWQNTIDMYRSLGLLQAAVRPEEILP